jgi:CPA1 family monovalent cation:H+ antiporter
MQEAGQLQIQLIASKAAQDELDSLLKAGVLPKAVYEETILNGSFIDFW